MKNMRPIALILCFAAMAGCGAAPPPAASVPAATSRSAAPEPAAEDWRNIDIGYDTRAVYAKDGVLLLTVGEEEDRMVCRLVTADGFDKTITVTVDDTNFLIAVSTDNYWKDSPTSNTMRLGANVDTENRSTMLSNGKMTCRLNFDTGEATVERDYTSGMMEEVIDSLDGLTLYSADSMGMGDGRWSDLVASVDKWTYRYICDLNNADTAVLLDEDTIAVNLLDTMEFYDTESGKRLDTKLDFDSAPDSEGEATREIVNMLPDREHRQLVVLARPAQPKEGGNGWEREYPVTMLIFDYGGKLLKQIDTGLKTPLHNDNGFFYSLNMSLSDGKVQIVDGKNEFLAAVAYR